MFIKMFKYDLSTLFKRMLLMYGVVLVSLALTYLADYISSFEINNLEIISFVLYGIFYISIASTAFFSFIAGIMYYYQTVFKDQGYLTNTLPLSKAKITMSKLLSNIIVYKVSVIFVIIILGLKTGAYESISFYLSNPGEPIITTILSFTLMYNVLFSYTLIYLGIIYLGISLGCAHSNNKFVISILYSAALSFIFTILSLLVMIIIINFVSGYVMDWDSTNMYVFFHLITLTLTITSIGILWMLNALNTKKRLNLE